MRVINILSEFAPKQAKADPSIVKEIENLMQTTDPTSPIYQGLLDLLQQIIAAGSAAQSSTDATQTPVTQPTDTVQAPPATQQPAPAVTPEPLPIEQEEEPLAESAIPVEDKPIVQQAKTAIKSVSYEEFVQMRDQLLQLRQQLADIEQKKKDIVKFANDVTSRIGIHTSWRHDLIGKLAPFGEDLSYNFLNHAVNGTGLTVPLETMSGKGSFRLDTIVADDIKAMFDPDHREAMKNLEQLPMAKGGRGGGIGPGEGLFALLLPNSKKPAKSDIFYNGENWEIKGVNYSVSKNKETGEIKGVSNSEAWLECSGELSGNTLGAPFRKITHGYLKNKINGKVKWDDGKTVTTVGDLIKLADFLKGGIHQMKYLLRLLTEDQKVEAIDSVYSLIFPTVKKKKKPGYVFAINLTLKLIEKADRGGLGDLHAKLAMYEYSLGPYQSPNFIVYNPTTYETVIITGTNSVASALKNPHVECSPLTIGNRAKASPGIFLATSQENRLDVEKQLGYTRKRPPTVRSIKEHQQALSEIDDLIRKYL
jgi:hypothetical protein